MESSSGLFLVASAWEAIRSKKNRVPWAALIWCNMISPRFQFNLWFITKNQLATQVLLLSYGRIDNAVCAFYMLTPDSIDHLFFGCYVIASLAFFWAARCNLPWRNRSWSENLQWTMKFHSGKDFYYCIARFSFGALCHLIWKNMNSILFREQTLVVPAMKNHLIKLIKDNALTFRNRRLQRNWGFDPIIFSSEVLVL